MSNEVFDIEELIKNHLGNQEEHTANDLFPQIEAKILKRKRKRRFFLLFLWFGLGIGAFILASQLVTSENKCECENYIEGVSATQGQRVFHRDRMPGNSNESRIAHMFNDLDSGKTLTELQPGEAEYVPEETGRNRGGDTVEKKLSERTDAGNQSGSTHSIADVSHEVHSPASPPINSEDDIALQREHMAKDVSERDTLSQHEVMHGDVQDTTMENSLSVVPAEPDEEVQNSEDALQKGRSGGGLGLFIYGGPSLYNVAVFKPYFVSGILSNRSFRSNGWDFSFGFSKSMGRHFEFNTLISYNRKTTMFSYDLLVGEEQYMQLNTDELVSLEQLDQENSCNCFLAKDASLSYSLSSVFIMPGISYRPFLWNKVQLMTTVRFGTNIYTQFKNKEQSNIEFPSHSAEYFSTYGIRLGGALGYKIGDRVWINVYPEYSIFFKGNSDVYSTNIKELILPVGIRFDL